MSTIHAVSRPSAVNGASTDAADTGTTTAPAEATTLLPEPTGGGLGDDAMTAIAILLVQADNKDRDTSRKIEDEADNAALADANLRVDQLKDKAGQDENQALVSGAFQLAGGVATAASGGLSDGTKSIDQVDPVSGVERLQSITVGTNWRTVVSGVGQALPGLGTILAAGHKAAADHDDAEAARFDALSQAAVRRYNGAHDDVQAANESIQKVEQFLQSVVQTQNETRNAAASMLRG
jgi:hypothetical protein